MKNLESCPANKEKCPTCVGIAKVAITETLGNLGRFNEDKIAILVENSRVETLVERPYIHEVFPNCEDRQRDANKIGKELAERIADNYKD